MINSYLDRTSEEHIEQEIETINNINATLAHYERNIVELLKLYPEFLYLPKISYEEYARLNDTLPSTLPPWYKYQFYVLWHTMYMDIMKSHKQDLEELTGLR